MIDGSSNSFSSWIESFQYGQFLSNIKYIDNVKMFILILRTTDKKSLNKITEKINKTVMKNNTEF